MRVYCDMDDILCETAATLCGLVNRMFGVSVSYEDVHDFDLKRSFGLSDGQMREFMAAAHESEFLLSYPETEGAVEGVRRLVAEGHRVDIVTGRPASSFQATEEWLRRAGLGDLSVTYVNKYGRLFVPDGEAPEMVSMEALRTRGYDVAIDDSPLVLPTLATWSSARVYVYSRPWNASFPLASNMSRMFSWSAFSLA